MNRVQRQRSCCPSLHPAQGFTLADALGIDVILVPPATHRTSFDHKARDLSPYYPAPADTLLDVAGIRQAYASRGVHVLEVWMGAGEGGKGLGRGSESSLTALCQLLQGRSGWRRTPLHGMELLLRPADQEA